jgi:hypothetical protein
VVQATLRHAFQIAGPEMRDLRIGHDAFVAAPTHATVATFRMDLSRESEQRDGLSHMIVPGVRSSPGFVAGTWTLDRELGQSVVLVTFDSVENATTFAENVRANAPHQAAVGIDLLTVRIVEISATA